MNVVEELKKIGNDYGFRIVVRGDRGYEKAREISNSRFDLLPSIVAFPEDAAQVGLCVDCCNRHEARFRVRSGGHHHEGMCSLDDGVMIRLSEINDIEHVREGNGHFVDDGVDRAWIGVGKPLQEVYDELEKGPEDRRDRQPRNKTIPGGGCQTVNIGGLTLGGGWGTSVRKMGLTCDNFDEAELVTADGRVLSVRADNEHSDLFWALRGGGGGNFGIVTRFLFRLWDIGESVSSFSMQWRERGRDEMVAIVWAYMEQQSELPANLSTTMGLRVKHRFMGTYHPIGLAGKYYGPVDELRELLKDFEARHQPDTVTFQRTRFVPRQAGFARATPTAEEASLQEGAREPTGQLSRLINDLVDHIHLGAPFGELGSPVADAEGAPAVKAPPRITCSDPWPHKISSAFTGSPEDYPAIAEKAIDILLGSNRKMPKNAARLYMVLHAMPGKNGVLKPADSAFYWRFQDFIVQFQAWWDPSAPGERDYLGWIASSRKTLEPHLRGAFVNFVDVNIPVEEYYGGNFERLKAIKKKWDPKNVFRFPLGIPLE